MSRHVPSRCLPVLVAILLSAQASALDRAADAVDAGYLWGLGITGSGVEVAVVDMFAADGTHPAIAGNFLGSMNFAVGPIFIAGHATAVAGAVASRDATYTGIAPDVGCWSGQTTSRGMISKLRNQTVAAETFAQGLGALAGNPAEVITLSISQADVGNGADQWSLALDHVIDTNGVIVTVAGGNDGPGGGTLSGKPPAAYNIITVGATGGTGIAVSEDYGQVAPYSSRGPTADGRSKPDIVAPGSQVHLPGLDGQWFDVSGTSLATPIVAGGAALLVDMGRQLGHTTDPRVIKSVLLNSAHKLPGWSHTPSEPLDPAQGAGQMNLLSAHRQYLSAEQDAGAVSGIGWDLGTVAGLDEALYSLGTSAPAGAVITATLTWNRTVTTDTEDIDKVVYSPDPLADLDLKLYLADDPANPVDVSASAIDNVEHVYFTLSEPGQYVLGVSSEAAVAAGYALAWSIGPAPGLDLPGDANLDGIVGIADLVALADHYGLTDAVWFHGDFNADGLVGVADLVALAGNYGAEAGTAAVPEPAALALLGAWAPATLRRRRRR